MKIEISDELAQNCSVDEKETQELLVIAMYNADKIDGIQAGKMLGLDEAEFHRLLAARHESSVIGIDKSVNVLKNTNLFGR